MSSTHGLLELVEDVPEVELGESELQFLLLHGPLVVLKSQLLEQVLEEFLGLLADPLDQLLGLVAHVDVQVLHLLLDLLQLKHTRI